MSVFFGYVHNFLCLWVISRFAKCVQIFSLFFLSAIIFSYVAINPFPFSFFLMFFYYIHVKTFYFDPNICYALLFVSLILSFCTLGYIFSTDLFSNWLLPYYSDRCYFQLQLHIFTNICLYSWIIFWHPQPCNLITWQFNYIIFKSWHNWIYYGFVSIVCYGTSFLVSSYLFLYVTLLAYLVFR